MSQSYLQRAQSGHSVDGEDIAVMFVALVVVLSFGLLQVYNKNKRFTAWLVMVQSPFFSEISDINRLVSLCSRSCQSCSSNRILPWMSFIRTGVFWSKFRSNSFDGVWQTFLFSGLCFKAITIEINTDILHCSVANKRNNDIAKALTTIY